MTELLQSDACRCQRLVILPPIPAQPATDGATRRGPHRAGPPMHVSSGARVPRRSHARARATLRLPGRSGVCLRHGCGQPLRVCPPQRAQPAAYARGQPVASEMGACPRRGTRASCPSEPRMGGPALGCRARPHRPRLSVRAWAAAGRATRSAVGGGRAGRRGYR